MWWIPAAQLAAKAVPAAQAVLNSSRKSSSASPSRTARPQRASSSTRSSLTTSQREAAKVIIEEFRTAQLPQELESRRQALALAAIVNAWHESRLNPQAQNANGEDSIGLFQINRNGALGAPYSRQQLRDPRINARVILTEVRARSQKLAAATTVADLTSAFAVHVERPADRYVKGAERAATARAWFGPLADATASGFTV